MGYSAYRVRACVVVVLLCVVGGLSAEEVAGPQPAAGPQPEVAGPQPGVTGPRESVSPQDRAVRGELEKLFRVAQEAWNRGDVDGFMEQYWKSDELTFSSDGKTTRGWQATRDRYKERFATRESMGQLTLCELEITPLGDAAAFVLGRWKLDKLDEPVGGNFTLVLRKIDGRWVIVHDHTSRLAE